MTAKEKSLELLGKFYSEGYPNAKTIAKEHSIICVDEILGFMNQLGWEELENGNVDYWQEVKTEIEQL